MTLACEHPGTDRAATHAARLQATIPALETTRLRLRAPQVGDFAYYAEITLGARGVHILQDRTRAAAWYDFAQMVACWFLHGHGLWTVETRADGRVAGFVLLGFEPGDHEPELGYMFRDWAEGRGFAAEAAQAARDYGFRDLGMTTLVSTVAHGNTRSAALAERLGAARDTAAEAAHGDKVMVYRHPSPAPRPASRRRLFPFFKPKGPTGER